MKLLLALSLALAACSSPTPKTPTPTTEVDAVQVGTAPTGPVNGEATLFLMADIRGVLRPCGCTVELQKGGFDRLIPYLEGERKQHPGSALLHAGPLFYEDAKPDAKKKAQREQQALVAADLVAQTKIDLAAATATDLFASGGTLDTLASRAKVTLSVANMTYKGKPFGPAGAQLEVKTVGGLRIGMFALASKDELPEGLDPAGIVVTDPEAAATTAVASLKGRADVIILMSGLGLRETKRLVRKIAGIDFALAGGMGEHPAYSDEAELVGTTRVMQFHREGRYVGRLALRIVDGKRDFVDLSAVSAGELSQLDERVKRLEAALAELTRTRAATDPEIASMTHHLASVKDNRDRLAGRKVAAPTDTSSFSFTITPIDWDLPQDAKVAEVMKAFDDELAKINIANAGTLPAPTPGQAVYVGTDACFECHAETREFWKTNEHAHAWTTLVDANKTFDTECVSCHVTGYGMAGGSLVGQTKGREAVQCEACHGPGSKHVEDTSLDSIVAKPTEASCLGCHNEHHSPRFKFSSFREHLLVPGHGRPVK